MGYASLSVVVPNYEVEAKLIYPIILQVWHPL